MKNNKSLSLIPAAVFCLFAPTVFADICAGGSFSNVTFKQLEVVAGKGACFLDHVVVKGGMVIDSGAHLQLTNSTVNGGVTVNPGGEFDLQAETLGSGVPISGSSTINGGIVLNNAADFDLWNAVINGNITITGPGNSSFTPVICNMKINGDLNLTDANQYSPPVTVGRNGCANTIAGSVNIDNSVVSQLFNNTINGELLCTNGGVVVTNSNNTILGSNTCY